MPQSDTTQLARALRVASLTADRPTPAFSRESPRKYHFHWLKAESYLDRAARQRALVHELASPSQGAIERCYRLAAKSDARATVHALKALRFNRELWSQHQTGWLTLIGFNSVSVA